MAATLLLTATTGPVGAAGAGVDDGPTLTIESESGFCAGVAAVGGAEAGAGTVGFFTLVSSAGPSPAPDLGGEGPGFGTGAGAGGVAAAATGEAVDVTGPAPLEGGLAGESAFLEEAASSTFLVGVTSFSAGLPSVFRAVCCSSTPFLFGGGSMMCFRSRPLKCCSPSSISSWKEFRFTIRPLRLRFGLAG